MYTSTLDEWVRYRWNRRVW